VGWIAPAANTAYRMTVFGDADPTPGMGEQSLIALRRQIEQFDRDPAFAQFGFPVALSFDYHRRLALSLSPLVFTLFALAMAGRIRRRWMLGIAACVAFVVYGWLVVRVTPWGLQPWDLCGPAYVAAWLPNATIATLAAVFGIVGARRQRAA
jgi:lipopolysaccharide export LptBFGC system permease protein LptF